MITYHLKSEVEPDNAVSVYDELITAWRKQVGFLGAALSMNEEKTTALSLSYWESEEDAEIAGSASLPLLFALTVELSELPPEVTGYDVLKYELPRV